MFCQYFDITVKLVNLSRYLAEFKLTGTYIIAKTTYKKIKKSKRCCLIDCVCIIQHI